MHTHKPPSCWGAIAGTSSLEVESGIETTQDFELGRSLFCSQIGRGFWQNISQALVWCEQP